MLKALKKLRDEFKLIRYIHRGGAAIVQLELNTMELTDISNLLIYGCSMYSANTELPKLKMYQDNTPAKYGMHVKGPVGVAAKIEATDDKN